MPTTDKRYLFKIIFVTLALTGALFGAHAWQARRIPAALLRQAERATQAQKPDAALRHLRQYLEFKPDDVAVQVRLADLVRSRSGDRARTELHFLYDKILRNDPAQAATRREALGLALRTGRYSDAVTHSEALLKATPTDSHVWAQLAAAQAGLRLHDAAKASFETALKHDETNLQAWQRLAQFIAGEMKRPAEAKPVVDRMVAALPKDPLAWLTRVRFALMTDEDKPLLPLKADPVLADLNRVLELNAKSADALLLKAERLQRHRDIAGARDCLTQGVANDPADGRLVRALAWLEVKRNNLPGAVAVLEDALPHAKDGLDLMVPLADLLLDAGNTAKAKSILTSLEKRTGSAVALQAKYLRSRLAMQDGHWEDAISQLTSLRTESVNLPGLETQCNQLLAQCHQKLGQPEAAVEALKLITTKDAGNITATAQLAQLHLNAGRTADALKAYEAAVASPFASATHFTACLRLQALALAQGNATPNDWAALEKKLQDLTPRYGQLSPEPARLRAEMLMLAGNAKAGVDVLRQEIARKSQSPMLWCVLASAVAQTESVAAGLAVLDEALGYVTDGVELRLTRAQLYAADPARLRPIELLEQNIEAWPDADQVQFAHGMIEVYDRLGRTAPHLWQRILSRRPNDLDVRLAACRSLVNDDSAQAQAVREGLQNWKFNDATLKLAAECLTAKRKAWNEMAAAIGPSPAQVDLCMIQGVNLARSGDATGHALIEKAWRMEPARFDTAATLLGSLAARGRTAELQRQMQSFARDPRWAGPAFKRLLQTAMVKSPSFGPDVCKDLFTIAKPLVEKQPEGRRWLGRMAQACGFNDIATTHYAAAAQAPGATVDDHLANILHATDKNVAQQVALAALGEKGFATLAAHLEALHIEIAHSIEINHSTRLAMLKTRLAILQARMDRDGAIALLQGVLEHKDMPPQDRPWAVRSLALMLVVRGEAVDRERAAKLLTDATSGNAGDTLDDRRTTAGVLAGLQKYLDGDARATAMNRAVEVMEGVAKQSMQAKDTFTLCRFYTNAGRPDAAVEKLRALLAADPGNVDYLLAGLDVLIEARQFESARGFADRLVKLAPQNYHVITTVARFECLTGHIAAGLALADSYFRSADPLVGDVASKTAKTAELLDELARLPEVMKSPEGRKVVDAAAARYEALLPGRAEAVIRMASLLAATGRVDEALERIGRTARMVPPRITANAGVTALGIAGGNDVQFAKVRTWIDAAKLDEPAAVPVRLGEAEWLTLKGDHAAAEAAYESILQAHPHNITALNNLAWLLAAKPESAAKALALIDRAVKETGLTGELLDTRARIRLAARQHVLAVQDAGEALKHARTPLRYFHLAMAFNDESPEHRAEAKRLFAEAARRGLTDREIHPADRDAYQQLKKQQ